MTVRNGPIDTQRGVSVNSSDDWQTLFLIRLLYLTYFMAFGILQPFLPVYYHSLGHGGALIGILGSITPFTTFLVAPIWGMISDWLGKPFTVLYITMAVQMICQLMVATFENPFYIMITVCLAAVFGAPVRPLIDSLVINQLSDRKQYGKMRLWSMIGTGFATSVAGRLLSIEGKTGEEQIMDEGNTTKHQMLRLWHSLTGYKLLFFAYGILHIPTFICMRRFQKLQMKENFIDQKCGKKRPGSIRQAANYVFRDVNALLFFALVYLMGLSAAIGDNFGYVRFREEGGTGKEMGFSRLLCGIAGGTMFFFSGEISARLGMVKVLGLSLLCVALRFTLYWVMDNPYYGYAAEMIRGMTFGCFWSASTVYASQIAPREVQATMVSVFKGLK